jgi:hypothetical protein
MFIFSCIHTIRGERRERGSRVAACMHSIWQSIHASVPWVGSLPPFLTTKPAAAAFATKRQAPEIDGTS